VVANAWPRRTKVSRTEDAGFSHGTSTRQTGVVGPIVTEP
jgi:hypothetical protein